MTKFKKHPLPAIKTYRKRYIILDHRSRDVCNKMAQEGKTAQQIAEYSGQSIRQAGRIIKMMTAPENLLNTNKPGPQKRGPKPTINDDVINEIREILDADNSLTIKGIDTILTIGMRSKLPPLLDISEHKIGRLLRDMTYTRKRLKRTPLERNSKRIIQQRQIYCDKISKIPKENFLCIDETGFNLHTSCSYGYLPEGQPAFTKVPANRGRNLSLIAAISTQGLVAYALVDGPINGSLFTSFLDIDLCQRIPEDVKVIVMDNARIHHIELVETWACVGGFDLEYLPAYSPELNPCENLFAIIKSRYNSIRPRPTTTDSLQKILIPILDSFVEKDLTHLFDSIHHWISKGQRGEAFD
jgi:transposase